MDEHKHNIIEIKTNRDGIMILNGRDAGVSFLSQTIPHLEKIQVADLAFNPFLVFPICLRQMVNLTSLDLQDTKIMELPWFVGELGNLTQLNLQGNQLTSVPHEIEKLTKLTYLNLSNNQLQKVPDEIYGLDTLTHLAMNGNDISFVSSRIGALGNLETLELNGNRLQTLPETVGILKKLKFLFIIRNMPRFILPWCISKMTSLQYLKMDEQHDFPQGLVPFIAPLQHFTQVVTKTSVFRFQYNPLTMLTQYVSVRDI